MFAATADIPGAVPLSEQAGVRLSPLTLADCDRLSRWMKREPDLRKSRYATGYLRLYCVHLRGRLACYMSIRLGRKLVGFCGWNNTATLDIFVHPDYRGQGIGTKAMRLLLNEARVRRKKTLVAFTSRTDFFVKLGFRQIHTQRLTDADRLYGRVAMQWGNWGGGRMCHGAT